MSNEIKVKKVTVRRPTLRELREKKIPLEKSSQPENQIVDVEFENNKTSDERKEFDNDTLNNYIVGWKEWILKLIRNTGSVWRDDDEKAFQQILQSIQQNPEIDVAYIEQKAFEIYNLQWDKKGIDSPFHQVKGIIRQVITDAQGKK